MPRVQESRLASGTCVTLDKATGGNEDHAVNQCTA